MRVLITGVAGFIGSNLAEQLLKNGFDVAGLDNLSTGSAENLKSFKKDIQFVNGDIRNIRDVRKAMKGVDYVLHHAALPSVPYSIENPSETHDVNVSGTLNVLVAARDENVKKVVFASSSAIYGDTKKLPISELDSLNPISPYAAHKLIGEEYCKLFYKAYGLRTTCLRYFNVYGPRQSPNSQYAAVIPKFVSLIKAGKNPVIYGDGTQTRDFIFVNDIVKANLLALNSSKSDGQSYNIASGRKISVLNLVNAVNKCLGSNVSPIFEIPRPGDVKHSYCDISKAKAELGFVPDFNLESGLRSML